LGSSAALGGSWGPAPGPARVRLAAGGAAELEPGEVLVCHTTDPSWSSYFFVAAAVVIDIGGPLSHGAIIARELGIPCVINTGTGTTSISSGDLLRVDGDAGTVEIIARAAATP
jgi:phosphoenolpyruvate synthase/pyruvate phosphate dikinase